MGIVLFSSALAVLRFREGHGFSRAVPDSFFSALAAEVKVSFQSEDETSGAKAQTKDACAVTARLKSCPSLRSSRNGTHSNDATDASSQTGRLARMFGLAPARPRIGQQRGDRKQAIPLSSVPAFA
ncbi:MAG: hypothetical protein DMG62_18030 [Acidobacteria bacterium]|nr:MAG: hypothetical protein DMG62_18030 [Acidobacteriota bacterium]